jgi:hypothetical protein
VANRRVPGLAASLVLFAFSVCVAAIAAADPLAVIAAFKGKVRVQPAKGGASSGATFGQPLERGDKVFVLAGGSATVFFNDGNVIGLSEKSSMTIGGRVAERPKVGPGSQLPGEVYSSVTRFVTGGSAQNGLVAMSSMRGTADDKPLLLAPRKTELLEPRPAFWWRAVAGATRYRIGVSGDSGELWNREVQGTTLEYPGDAAPLGEGADYLWEVRAYDDHGEARREGSFFHVLGAGDAAAIRGSLGRIRDSAGGADSPASHFLSGSYLFGRGLYRDAAFEFEALSKAAPRSSAPHEALGNVYRAVGLMDLAAAEYQRALSLSREP